VVEFGNDRRFYRKTAQNRRAALYVAATGRNVVGYVLVTREDTPDDLTIVPRASVDELAVAHTYRRRGVGRALLASAERWARKQGLQLVQLAVWAFNRPAKRLFRHAGYRPLMVKLEKRLAIGE
jgi:ribosomal protein S18 acetylase RimI-like enzyme